MKHCHALPRCLVFLEIYIYIYIYIYVYQNASCRTIVDVVDTGDRPVSIQRYGDQMEYGGCAAEHVERRPRFAQLRTEEPSGADLVDGGERHHQGGDHQIGDGERRDQVVGDVAQVTLEHDGGDDEDVAEDRQQDNEAENDGCDEQVNGSMRQRERRQRLVRRGLPRDQVGRRREFDDVEGVFFLYSAIHFSLTGRIGRKRTDARRRSWLVQI